MADDLVQAANLYTSVTQLIRLCLDDDTRPEDFPPGLGELLCRACDLPDMKRVESQLSETARSVRKTFNALLRSMQKS